MLAFQRLLIVHWSKTEPSKCSGSILGLPPSSLSLRLPCVSWPSMVPYPCCVQGPSIVPLAVGTATATLAAPATSPHFPPGPMHRSPVSRGPARRKLFKPPRMPPPIYLQRMVALPPSARNAEELCCGACLSGDQSEQCALCFPHLWPCTALSPWG